MQIKRADGKGKALRCGNERVCKRWMNRGKRLKRGYCNVQIMKGTLWCEIKRGWMDKGLQSTYDVQIKGGLDGKVRRDIIGVEMKGWMQKVGI